MPTPSRFPLQEQLAAEGGDSSAYAQSHIVQTSAPRELGSLRAADGQEGFDAHAAKQAIREGFEAAGPVSNGHADVKAA